MNRYVTLWVSVSSEPTRDIDPDDENDAGEYAETLLDYGVTLGAPTVERYVDRDVSIFEDDLDFDVNNIDILYMVIENYGTGSTRGSTNPQFRPVKVFRNEHSALEWVNSEDAANAAYNDWYGGHNEYFVRAVEITKGR